MSSLVSTLAGAEAPGQSGYQNGIGTYALFENPFSLMIDPTNGDIYVGEFKSCHIRKINSLGEVSIFAGNLDGKCDSVDGRGTYAEFYSILSLIFNSLLYSY